MNNNNSDLTTGKLIIGFVVALVVVFIIFGSFTIVDPGERGVVVRFGNITDRTLNEGFHWKLPIADDVVKMDVTTQKKQVPADAASQDLQEVSAEIALNYQLDPTKVNKIYQTYYREYDERYIAPSLQESVKAATAKFNAEELITQRPKVREEIKKQIKDKLEPKGIIVKAFNVNNFSFSESFSKSIEAKVTAEQKALEAKNRLEKIEYQADQRIAKAKGEAESIRIKAKALRNNPAILKLRAIEKWDGKLPKYMGSREMPFLRLNPGQ